MSDVQAKIEKGEYTPKLEWKAKYFFEKFYAYDKNNNLVVNGLLILGADVLEQKLDEWETAGYRVERLIDAQEMEESRAAYFAEVDELDEKFKADLAEAYGVTDEWKKEFYFSVAKEKGPFKDGKYKGQVGIVEMYAEMVSNHKP